ncbi:PSR [Symbiodinium sp. CCMP2592]|nr:PSR [Symbiodinium sp. CCMP2592]
MVRLVCCECGTVDDRDPLNIHDINEDCGDDHIDYTLHESRTKDGKMAHHLHKSDLSKRRWRRTVRCRATGLTKTFEQRPFGFHAMRAWLKAYAAGSGEVSEGPTECMGQVLKGRDLARALAKKWRGWLTREECTLLRGASKPFGHKPVRRGPRPKREETLLPDIDKELVDQILSSLPAAMQEDLFDRFPRCLRPSRLCLFGATAGAQCDAHADHLDWTGWSLLLAGRKLWRFLPNTPATAEVLSAWRESFGLSGPGGELFSIAGSWNTQEDLFKQDPWRGIEVLQEAGEIIVFPGSWFHQTRAEEDSWAVCAQLLNTSNVDSVVGHICDWCKIPRPISSTTEQKIDDTLGSVLAGRVTLGGSSGREALCSLRLADLSQQKLRSSCQELPAEELIALRWASAALKATRLAPWLQTLAADAAHQLSSRGSAGALCAVTWAAARLSEADTPSLLAAALPRILEASAEHIAALAWALAHAAVRSERVAGEASSRFSELRGSLGPTAWALRELSSTALLDPRVGLRKHCEDTFRQGGCPSALRGLVELGADWPTVAALCARSSDLLSGEVAWALATSGLMSGDDLAGHPLIEALVLEVAERRGLLMKALHAPKKTTYVLQVLAA